MNMRLCLSLSCLLVLVLLPFGCTHPQPRPTVNLPPDRLDLQRFNPVTLELAWPNDLQLTPGESLKNVWLTPQSLYCLTSLNMLHRLDRQTGITTWIRQPAQPGQVVFQPAEANGKTLVIAHHVVTIYDTVSGKLLWEFNLPFPANSAPAFDGNVFYVADSVDRVQAIETQTGLVLWTCRAEQLISAKPALLGNLLIAASESGEALPYDTLSHSLAWSDHFRTRGPLRADPLLTMQGRCYLAGADKMLYCLRSATGEEVWRYFAGQSLLDAPAVTDNRVFQPLPHGGLVVLNAKDGSELEDFNHPGAKQYLAAINQRIYLLAENRRLLCLDAQTGRQLAEISMKDFDFFLTNTDTPKLYAASTAGRVICLQQLGLGPLKAPGK